MKNQEKLSSYREDLQTHFPQLLAKHLITERGFETSIPKEAHKFDDSCDVILVQGVSTLTIACILGRTNHPPNQGTCVYERAIKLVQQALLSLDKTNSLRKPDSIQIYEIGKGPLTVSEKLHLRELAEQAKSIKAIVNYFYIDTKSSEVWTNSKQSRLSDIYELLSIWVKNPEQPVFEWLYAKPYFPFVTLAISAVLVLVFGIEILGILNPFHEN